MNEKERERRKLKRKIKRAFEKLEESIQKAKPNMYKIEDVDEFMKEIIGQGIG